MKDEVEVLDESHVGEQKMLADEKVPEEEINKRELVMADELRDAEDDVFEEAIDSQEGLSDHGQNHESDDLASTYGNTGSEIFTENSNAGNDADTFEEAIGTPVDVCRTKEAAANYSEEVAERGIRELVKTPDETYERGIASGATGSDINGKKEGLDVSASGEAEFSEGEIEADAKSILVAEKHGKNDEKGLRSDTIPWNEIIENENRYKLQKDFDRDSEVCENLLNNQNKESNGSVVKDMDDNPNVGLSDSVNQHGKGEEEEKSFSRRDAHQVEEALNSNDVLDCISSNKLEKGGVENALNNGAVAEESVDRKSSISGTSLKDHTGENVQVVHNKDGMVENKTGGLGVHLNGSKPENYIVKEVKEVQDSGPVAGQNVTVRNKESRDYTTNSSQSDDGSENISDIQSSEYVAADAAEFKSKAEASQNGQKSRQIHGEREVRPPSSSVSSARKFTGNSIPARPAGLGRAAPLLEPAARVQQPRGSGSVSSTQSQQVEDPASAEVDEHDETREKLQMIRVKFLRLAHRLGQTPHNVVVAQVLYRLGLAEQLRGRNGSRVGAFSFDRASAMAEQLEAAGQPLDFSCTIMVLGKTGVGKSATINSIFDEMKFSTDAFEAGTKKVQDVVGTVQGIRVRVIDTPGLLPSWSDQRRNEKILQSIKRFIKKTPPDIVLYLDRLDMQTRDFGDSPLLRTITEIFGPSIWFNAIVVLTHAGSAPPDGPNGTASSYDMFVTQRSHVIQQAIRQAAGDMRLMNPVSLVENHSACRTNRAGQRVLPNGQVWKPHLLLLSFASKILAEANALLKLQDSPPGRPFTVRSKAPPLPFLLSTLLQSRPQIKLPDEQYGDEDDPEYELDDSSDSESESEYDKLPPFKRLTKVQMAKLTRTQRKEYLDELEYREKLFMKKQLKEDRKRWRMMKKLADAPKDMPNEYNENVDDESGGPASVPVPMPDLALPASFDSDNPTHRYRYLDSSNQWLVRPVLETHGWDHDVGYEGVNVERMFVIKEKIPISFSGQVTKDKKDATVQMELASSIKHGEGRSTSLGFDMQNVGKELAYTLRSEMKFNNFRKNNAAAGLSVTLLGDSLSAGLKVEDKLIASKRLRLVLTGGAMTGRGDIAYGGSLEAQLRDKDYPLGRFLSTLGLSVMDWHGDLAIGGNIQSQIPVGRSTNLVARANLNNRGAGQVSIRLNSSEQLQIAVIALVPFLKKLVNYRQRMQYGQ